MIEFNCQLFLNQYLKNDTKLRYSQENKNALLILDTRPSLNLILVIRNALDKIKKANLIIVGNEEVFDLVDRQIGKEYFRVNINTHQVPLFRYNNLLINQIFTDENFWKQFKEEKIFVFQSDCIFLRNYNFDEFNYGMLGPVCFSREKDKFVIQGGFSIRNKQLMIELSSLREKFIEQNLDKKIVKDIYFTNLIRQNYPNLFPAIKECDEFAIESWGDYKKAIGIHGTDKYYAKPNFYKEVFNYLELQKNF